MAELAIVGIGVISNLGNDVDSVWQQLCSSEPITMTDEAIKYESVMTAAQRRRANRYSDMTIYTAKNAFVDSKLDKSNIDEFRIGTIFTTGYGPLVSNLKFAESVAGGDPDACSPTVFSNTVSNTCVGYVCMNLGCKGVSTVIMGSNNIGYSQMLIEKGDADYILTGSVEEYCEELYDAFKTASLSKDITVKEGTVTFLVRDNNKEDGSEEYCRLLSSMELNIGDHPLMGQIERSAIYSSLVSSLKKIKAEYKIDTVFTSNNGSYFDSIESDALNETFGDQVTYVNNVKAMMGETLGSAYNMNVLVGALSLKHGKLPYKLDNKEKELHTILVTGYDVSGNYIMGVYQK
jgi:3-oxoacyl-[acyl-carrier-protein] synthase II